jgi:signal transduction histidine kinase
VILLDVNMPGLSGLETAALIRTRKKSAHTPIIFLTAFADEIRAAEGYAHGAVDFITSPIVPPILRAKVQVFVELYNMTAQIKQHAEERIAHAHERSKREAAEDANRRLSFLARAGAVITKSLDRAVTTESILRLLVPEHADQAVLAEVTTGGQWRGVWASRFEESMALAGDQGLTELPDAWRHMLQRSAVAAHAESATIGLDGSGSDPLHLLALPLRDREHVFAVLLVVRGATYGEYLPADIAMFESIAWRSAIAMVNARLYEEIERSDQQKNRFLSMLAHELRNPLAPIRSAVDVLRLGGQNPEEIAWARDVIDRQVTHLVRLVDDLLDISRITLGKIRLVVNTLDAAELVTAAVEISRPLIEKNSHELVLAVPDEPVPMIGDRARLTQVLSNLLNNAAKYTPPGGSIHFSLDHEDDSAVFRIRDTGVGIPQNMLDKVFDMFIQIDHSLDRAHGGLGIGLTLVRELVQMHQGRITVTSAGLDEGSEFVIRLPCGPKPAAHATADYEPTKQHSLLKT